MRRVRFSVSIYPEKWTDLQLEFLTEDGKVIARSQTTMNAHVMPAILPVGLILDGTLAIESFADGVATQVSIASLAPIGSPGSGYCGVWPLLIFGFASLVVQADTQMQVDCATHDGDGARIKL